LNGKTEGEEESGEFHGVVIILRWRRAGSEDFVSLCSSLRP